MSRLVKQKKEMDVSWSGRSKFSFWLSKNEYFCVALQCAMLPLAIAEYALVLAGLLIALSGAMYLGRIRRRMHRKCAQFGDVAAIRDRLPSLPIWISLLLTYLNFALIFVTLTYERLEMQPLAYFGSFSAGLLLAICMQILIYLPLQHNLMQNTVYQYLRDRLGSGALQYVGTISFLLFSISLSTLSLIIFSDILSTNQYIEHYYLPIIISFSALTFASYVFMGGSPVVLWADSFHCIIALMGVIYIVYQAFTRSFLQSNMRQDFTAVDLDNLRLTPHGDYSRLALIVNFLSTFIAFSCLTTHQLVAMRCNYFETVKKARISLIVIAGIVVLTVGVVHFVVKENISIETMDPVQLVLANQTNLINHPSKISIIDLRFCSPAAFLAVIFCLLHNSIANCLDSSAMVIWHDLLNRVNRIERDRTKMLLLRLCEIPIAVLPILIYLSTFVFEKIIVTMISIGSVIFLVIPITAILMLLPLFPCATRTGINATLSITLALTLVILVVQFFGSTFIASELFSPKLLNNSNGTIEDYSVLHNYSLGIIDQGHGNYWLNQWHINTIIYYQALGIAAFFLPIILGFWLSLCSGRCRIDRHSTQLLAPCITRLCACLLPQEEIRKTVNAQQQTPIVIPRTRRINRDRGERIRSILSEDGFFRVDVDSYPMLMEGTARSTASSRQPVDQLFNDLQTNNNLSK